MEEKPLGGVADPFPLGQEGLNDVKDMNSVF